MLKPGQWAREYDRCQECGTTERPHYARGLCERCYHRLYKRRRRQAEKERMAAAKEGS